MWLGNSRKVESVLLYWMVGSKHVKWVIWFFFLQHLMLCDCLLWVFCADRLPGDNFSRNSNFKVPTKEIQTLCLFETKSFQVSQLLWIFCSHLFHWCGRVFQPRCSAPFIVTRNCFFSKKAEFNRIKDTKTEDSWFKAGPSKSRTSSRLKFQSSLDLFSKWSFYHNYSVLSKTF